MAQCITCKTQLHPKRAKKYDYCTARECQEKNAKGLTMVAVGVNKAAEQYLILDEHTREELASGKYRDQRRGSFGTPVPAPRAGAKPQTAEAATPARRPVPAPARRAAARKPARRPWSRSQEKLALLYNEQGIRPQVIAERLGLSTYIVTQIILSSKNRGKL